MEAQLTRPVQVAIGVLAVILALGLGGVLLVRYQAEQRAMLAAQMPLLVSEAAPAEEQAEEPPVKGTVFVHVAGSVRNPGLFELPEGARLADAITVAGGPLPEGRPDALNLAAKVVDGGKLYVFTEEELTAAVTPAAAAGATWGPVTSEGAVASASGGSGVSGGKVNINTASKKELETLPGVGPATAQNILDYRAQKGPFKRPEDLVNVKNIGAKSLEKLLPHVTT